MERKAADAGPGAALAVTLRGVHAMTCEWLPLSPDIMALLNERLGSCASVKGGFFSDQVDPAPSEQIYCVEDGAGITSAVILDYEENSYINYEAEVFFPEEPGIIQIEHIGMHFDYSGFALYGVRIDGVEARDDDSLDPSALAQLLVDIREDSSLLAASVLEAPQRRMLEVRRGRSFSVIFARPRTVHSRFSAQHKQEGCESDGAARGCERCCTATTRTPARNTPSSSRTASSRWSPRGATWTARPASSSCSSCSASSPRRTTSSSR